MKKALILPLLFLTAGVFTAAAEKYRIEDVSYERTGMTTEYAIRQAVTVSTKRIFNSYEELNSYVKDIKQQLENERVFSSVITNIRYDETDGSDDSSAQAQAASSSTETSDSSVSESNKSLEETLVLVHLTVTTIDSYHFLGMPYYKFDSNTGHVAKLKIKDSNFLGTMNVMDFDFNFTLEKADEGRSENYKNPQFGINFDYDYPFPLGPVKASWNNTFSINYTIGDSLPQYGLDTGFTFEIPFDEYSLQFDLTQSINRNTDDYEKYGDELYFTEEAKVSLPVHIADIDNWGKVNWTPYVKYTTNWDKDGIDEDNDDLSSPVYTIGHSVSTSRINWRGNFRQGMSLDAGQSFSYNQQKDEYIPEVTGEVTAFKAFKYVGFCTDIYVFGCLNGKEKIGSRLRGIRDNQYYDDTEEYALKVPGALVCNFDLPIHIITTDWLGFEDFVFGSESKARKAFDFMRYFDFEMQFSPFFDFALTKNDVAGSTFNYKDGFYAAGLEVLVYPAKWKGFVVRGSLGVDIGRKIIYKAVPSLINTDWRDMSVSTYEFTFGIGWQY